MSTLAQALAGVRGLLEHPCELDVKKESLWGHVPATLPARVFDWRTAAIARRMRRDYEDYLVDGGLMKGKEWVDVRIPFAVVAVEGTAAADVAGDYFAVLLFDLPRGRGATCPVWIAQTDSWRPRRVAASVAELGLRLANENAKPPRGNAKESAFVPGRRAAGDEDRRFNELWSAIGAGPSNPKGSPDAVRSTLAGFDPNVLGQDSEKTLLGLACNFGRLDLLEVLLASGADPNLRTLSGGTPLMVAAEYGRADCAKRLLAAGADPCLANARGKTAADVAKKAGAKGLVRTLVAAAKKAR